MNNVIRELNCAEIDTVAGGLDDWNWCGTVPLPFPWAGSSIPNLGWLTNLHFGHGGP